MTTLISLLGKGSRTEDGGYRLANYRFDADFIRTVPFFGLALAEYLKPQRLVLAGTAGSMWDVFLQQHAADDETVLQLMDAVENNAVTQSLLNSCEAHLSQQLGLPVTCLLIPFARDADEQVAILQALAGVIGEGERVAIDVTHGFRHLPMLALVAARYLTHVRQVRIEELYYGALEMTANSETPVLRLGSLLRMLDWTEALAINERCGDYAVFADLLADDGMPAEQAAQLKQAAFYERTNNPVRAREKLSTVFESINNHLGALGSLFRETLSKRVNWFRKSNRAEWELALAEAYLTHKDYLRASTYLYESCVTRAALEQQADIHDFEARKAAFKCVNGNDQTTLRFLRNGITHGLRKQENNSPPGKRAEKALSDQHSLDRELRSLLKILR